MGQGKDVVVVGAGIVGICCARWLQQEGYRVRVLDPEPPGSGCSLGNAGVFALDSVIPLATPATLAAVPGMLFDATGPLALRWSYLPRLLPWMLRFASNARPSRVASATRALESLCGRGMQDLLSLVKHRPTESLLRPTGWMTVFETRAGLHAGQREAQLKANHGVDSRILGRNDVRTLIPGIADHVVGGVLYPDCWMCTDPQALVQGMARDFVESGGVLQRTAARRIQAAPGRVCVATEDDPVEAEHVVVAAGAHSRALSRSLGDDVPLDTERGYHVMMPGAELLPPMPVMSGEYKFVATPMDGGLRLAGTSELGGLELPPDPRRIGAIVERARRLYPGLRAPVDSDWMGFRPTLPDSVPVIGRATRHRNVSYAFGHQHLGLTLAGVTARLIADDVAGRESVVDMHPFRVNRF
ncbi:MAG: FAD-dependent oxidoreductase [Ectothiorhodospiraceae bacterium]